MFFLSSRCALTIVGKNTIQFLSGLLTADLRNLTEGGFLFSALLNSKGRFLYDFFLHQKKGEIFIDINKNQADSFKKAILQYDLLDDFKIEDTHLQVFASKNFLLNWKDGKFEGRFLLEDGEGGSEEEYNLERIKLCLPDGALELKQEKSIILEYGYEEAGAVSFDKGCYIGQELITRTKRVGEVRKALYCLHLEGKQKPIDALSSFGDYALILGYKQDFEGKDIIEINGIKYKVLC